MNRLESLPDDLIDLIYFKAHQEMSKATFELIKFFRKRDINNYHDVLYKNERKVCLISRQLIILAELLSIEQQYPNFVEDRMLINYFNHPNFYNRLGYIDKTYIRENVRKYFDTTDLVEFLNSKEINYKGKTPKNYNTLVNIFFKL